MSQVSDQKLMPSAFHDVVNVHGDILCRFSDLKPNAVMDSSWDYFSRLSRTTQQTVIDEIRWQNRMLIDALNCGIKLTSDRRLSWFAISRLGMVPCSDAFEQIKDSDFVEIYSAEGIQIFRNLEFYRLISYTIAEITLYPWDKLYGRKEVFAEQIRSEAFDKALDGRRVTFRPAISDHDSFELMSRDQRSFHIRPGVISPLFDKKGRAVAFLATSQRSRIV